MFQKRRSHRLYRQLSFEPYEDRRMLSTITWTGASTTDPNDWNDVANWDLGQLPTAGDDVTIPDVAATTEVVLERPSLDPGAGNFSFDSLVSDEQLRVESAYVTVPGTIQVNNQLTIWAGATINDATIQPGNGGSVLVIDGSHLTNLTINADVNTYKGSGYESFAVENLTLNGKISLDSHMVMRFVGGDQHLAGNGEVVGDAVHSSIYSPGINIGGPFTVTVDPGITIRPTNSGPTDRDMYITGDTYVAGATLVNQGTIRAPADTFIHFDSFHGMTVINQGLIEATHGATVTYNQGVALTNTTTGTVRAVDGSTILALGSTTATGTLRSDGSRFDITALTPQPVLDLQTDNGGRIDLADVAGAGQTVSLNYTNGAVYLHQTWDGGTIDGTSPLYALGNLKNVLINTDIVAIPAAYGPFFENITALNGVITINSGSRLVSNITQTLPGTGEIVFHAIPYNGLPHVDIPANTTLTIAPGITVRGIGRFNGIRDLNPGALINQGTISPGEPGGTIEVSGTYTQDSSGALDISIGGVGASDYGALWTDDSTTLDGDLNVSFVGGFTPSVGQSFLIVNKLSDGAIDGTFAGLPEGTVFNSGGVPLQITYAGNTGNDVVLTVVSSNEAPDTPVDSDSTANAVAEGAVAGTTVGITAQAGDPNGDAVTYALTNNAGGWFDIEANTGVVTVANGALLDGPATRTITVEAADPSGMTSTADFTIVVNNIAPTVSLNAVATIYENGTATLTGSFTDPGTLDTFTLDVDWGDPLSPDNVETYTFGASNTGSQTFSLTHQYLDDNPSGDPSNTYTINATVTDDDGGSDSANTIVTVNNVAPDFEAGPDVTLLPGDQGHLHRTISFADPGSLDVWTGTVDYSDGAGPQPLSIDAQNKTIELDHTYSTQKGLRTIIVTLNDDDGGSHTDQFDVDVIFSVVEFTQAVYDDGEGAGTSTVVTLTRDDASSSSEVLISIVGGTADGGIDYGDGVFPLRVTFDPGEWTNTVVVPISDDSLLEGDETIQFEMTPVNFATIGAADTATLTIQDDERGQLVFTAPASTTMEGDSFFDVFVELDLPDGVSVGPGVSVSVAAEDAGMGTATSGLDYASFGTQRVTFGPGSSGGDTQVVRLAPLDDLLLEGDETVELELVELSLSGPNVSLGTVSAHQVTIQDAERGQLVFTAPASTAMEGDSFFDVFVELDLPDGVSVAPGVSVSVAAEDAGTGTATSGLDYASFGTQRVTFGPGSTGGDTQVVRLAPLDDPVVELDETIELELVALSLAGPNVSLGSPATHEVTIVNDDAATLQITDASVSEGDRGDGHQLAFDVTLSTAVDVPLTVNYQTSNGSAEDQTGDDDYQSSTGALSFDGNQNEARRIYIDVNGDNKEESDETLFVDLSNIQASGRNVTFADDQGLGTIVNDDFAPLADAGGPYVIHEGDPLTLDATSSSDPEGDALTYRWDVDGDGAYDENVTGMNPVLTRTQLAALSLADGPRGNTVTVEASDGTNIDTANTTLTILNVAPTITALVSGNPTPCSASQDGSITIDGAFFDPAGSFDTHTATVDWGDGEPVETLTAVDQVNDLFDGGHKYAHGGVFTITVTVDDEDGGVSESMTTTAAVQGAGVVDGTLYIIGSDGRDHVDLKFKEKKDELKVDIKLDQGGSDGGSDAGSDGGGDHIKQTYQASAIDRIVAYLCGGDDHYNGGSDGGSDGRSDGGSAAAIPQFVFAGGGNDHIQGGRAGDVLVGGDGRDKLFGRNGNDLLIGGTGKDDLKGGVGDDLLIAGSTAYDNYLTALDAIVAEWGSEASYADRVAALQTGVGPDGDVKLEVGSTVFADGDRDKLDGGKGQEWIFADDEDTVHQQRDSEGGTDGGDDKAGGASGGESHHDHGGSDGGSDSRKKERKRR